MSPEQKLRVVEILRQFAQEPQYSCNRWGDEMLALAEELEVNLAGDTSGTRPGAEATAAWVDVGAALHHLQSDGALDRGFLADTIRRLASRTNSASPTGKHPDRVEDKSPAAGSPSAVEDVKDAALLELLRESRQFVAGNFKLACRAEETDRQCYNRVRDELLARIDAAMSPAEER